MFFWRAAWTCKLLLMKRAEEPVLTEDPPPPPMFSHPAGKLVNERLMAFSFNMRTRRSHRCLCMCEWGNLLRQQADRKQSFPMSLVEGGGRRVCVWLLASLNPLTPALQCCSGWFAELRNQ
ncbi:hypothetical protein Q8A73_023244 [Channa argus]|nr:hypothetical protein Q8A73_023244 [Channa argus]